MIDAAVSERTDEDLIVLSAPTEPAVMKELIAGALIDSEQYMCLFCCDIIVHFLVPSKRSVLGRLPANSDYVYEDLLSANAVSIIHVASGDVFNLPRELSPGRMVLEFMDHAVFSAVIRDCVYRPLSNQFPECEFKLIDADWSHRVSFYGIFRVGYRCDDGVVIPADIITQKDQRIFIHFQHFQEYAGSKFGWVAVPNDRLSPPPKNFRRRSLNIVSRARAATR